MTGKTIYLLEDDPDILQLLTLLLTRKGYRVHTFSSVNAFNQGMASSLPDICILDVNLPDGNGFDVSRNLTKLKLSKKIPVLIMSARQFSLQQCQQAGADSFIGKPFSIDGFIEALAHLP